MFLKIAFDLLFFFIIPTLVSVWVEYHKLYDRKIDIIHRAVYYILSYWCIIAAIKTATGEYNCTILDSFSENGFKTYIHYIIPISVLVVFLVTVNKYISGRTNQVLQAENQAVSISLCVLGGIYMFLGHITNFSTLVAGIAGVMSVGVLKLLGDKSIPIRESGETKKKLRNSMSVIGFWTISVLFFVPVKLYLTNPDEFHINLLYYVLVLVIGSVLFTCLLSAVCTWVLPSVISEVFIVIIFLLTILGYLQENFLNGHMRNMDGTEQIWSSGQKSINGFLWIAVILIGLILYKKHKEKFIKTICIISVYISLIQIFTFGYLAFTAQRVENTYILTNTNVFELSDKSNTIVFVLDWYDEQILEEIVSEDKDFLEPLDGFTWYKNQTSRYAFTFMSIPYMLTNVRWEEGMNEIEYTDYAYEKSTFLEDIKKAGYGVGLYTDSQCVRDKKGIVENYIETRGKCKFGKTISMMSDCSRYEMSPLFMKKLFHYSTSAMSEMLPNQDMFLVHNYSFYTMLKEDGISVTDRYENGAFKFYHINGCHDYDINENIEPIPTDIYDCGKGTMRIVYEYIDELKRNNLYDSSTIIITADHGQNLLNDDEGRKRRGIKKNTSNPILLIKCPHENGSIHESYAPVSHDDLCATVMESVDGDSGKYGIAYMQIEENETRKRDFEYYRSGDIPYQKYVIDGLATDENSWILEEDNK